MQACLKHLCLIKNVFNPLALIVHVFKRSILNCKRFQNIYIQLKALFKHLYLISNVFQQNSVLYIARCRVYDGCNELDLMKQVDLTNTIVT